MLPRNAVGPSFVAARSQRDSTSIGARLTAQWPLHYKTLALISCFLLRLCQLLRYLCDQKKGKLVLVWTENSRYQALPEEGCKCDQSSNDIVIFLLFHLPVVCPDTTLVIGLLQGKHTTSALANIALVDEMSIHHGSLCVVSTQPLFPSKAACQ